MAAFYNRRMRAPDERFANLPGFPWAPHYLEWRGMRVHYLDEGEGARTPHRTLLCLHGEPTWSYLYRNMLLHVIEKLDLSSITLAVQDWGGLLGLTLPMEMPGRFERLLVMNTALGTGDVPLSEGFIAWRAYVAKTPNLDCAKLLARSCAHLSPSEAAAYEAPYPDDASKAGVRRFPSLVPDRPDAPGAAISRRARDWWSNSWKGESFMAIGAKDPVLGIPVMQALRRVIRDCPEPYIHAEGGHFLQEWGGEVAAEALKRWK